jgi:hypothetical protein
MPGLTFGIAGSSHKKVQNVEANSTAGIGASRKLIFRFSDSFDRKMRCRRGVVRSCSVALGVNQCSKTSEMMVGAAPSRHSLSVRTERAGPEWPAFLIVTLLLLIGGTNLTDRRRRVIQGLSLCRKTAIHPSGSCDVRLIERAAV